MHIEPKGGGSGKAPLVGITVLHFRPELVKAQQTPARLTSGGTISFAAGLHVTTMDGIREVSHSGATGGYRTWLGRFPDQGVSVAVLCNSAQANPTKLGYDTARLWTGTGVKTAPANYTASPAKLEALAGMYRKTRDNTVAELRVAKGKLTLTPGTELTAVGENQFLAPGGGRQFRFEEGSPVRMRAVSADDDVVYERVEPAQPGVSDLAALVGQYESRETGSVLTVAAGEKAGELSLRVSANPPMRLRPTFRDAFVALSGSSVFFVRNAEGKVISLSAGEDRVWDLRFTRVR